MNKFEKTLEFIKINRFIFLLIFLILFMMVSVFFSREANNDDKSIAPIQEKSIIKEDYTVTYKTNGEIHILVRNKANFDINKVRAYLGVDKYANVIVEVAGAAEYIGDQNEKELIYEGDLSNVGN